VTKELEEQLVKFFSKYRLQTFKKGEIMSCPGDKFSEVLFVDKGYVRLFATTSDGREITIGNFKPTFFISALCALNACESPFYQECVTEVSLWKAPTSDFQQLLEKNSQLSMLLFKHIASVTENLLLDAVYTKTGNAESKITGILFSLVNTLGKEEGNHFSIDFDVPHRIIATLTGLTRETVSFHMKQLENKGVVKSVKGKLIITDVEALRDTHQT